MKYLHRDNILRVKCDILCLIQVGGRDGALQIANTLAQRGLHFEFIIDEGCTVLNGIVPTVKTPVGL